MNRRPLLAIKSSHGASPQQSAPSAVRAFYGAELPERECAQGDGHQYGQGVLIFQKSERQLRLYISSGRQPHLGHPRSAAEGGVLNQGGYGTGRRRDAAETSTTTWSTFRNIQGSGLDRRCVALFLARKSINGTRKRMSAAPTTRERVSLLTITFPKPASRPTTARPRYTQDGRGTWLDHRVIPKKSLHRRTSRFHWRASFIAFAPD